MNYKSRKGNYLVEAVLVVPIIAIISVMMICASVYLYVKTATVADMAVETSSEAGSISETVFFGSRNPRDGFSDEFDMDFVKKPEYPQVRASAESVFNPGIRWFIPVRNRYFITRTGVSECSIIWQKNL